MALVEIVQAKTPVLAEATMDSVGGVLQGAAVADAADTTPEALAVTLAALLASLRSSGAIAE
ncbi:hypothetical protein 6995_0053 [Klebsiella phage 6995]|uniref:Uncharacterized protein n=1 Tax=Klebsiella phage 6995 TaxID=2912298 RepID=A0A9E7M8L3_9CAUD|nr:hypothetical protein 6995_0053 [Klebsiella phage 6995]